MYKEIVVHDVVSDPATYNMVKSLIGKIGHHVSDTQIFLKDNDFILRVHDQNLIDSIKKVLIENNIRSTYVEIGD